MYCGMQIKNIIVNVINAYAEYLSQCLCSGSAVPTINKKTEWFSTYFVPTFELNI